MTNVGKAFKDAVLAGQGMTVFRGFWQIEGPHYDRNGLPKSRRWRAQFTPTGRNGYQSGVGWGITEDDAKKKAMLRARLRNTTRTSR